MTTVKEDIELKVDAGLLPFVPCDHDSNGASPSSVLESLVGWVVYCTECLATWGLDDVQWVTPSEARLRWGWTIKPDSAAPS